jgi:hypothetical protein
MVYRKLVGFREVRELVLEHLVRPVNKCMGWSITWPTEDSSLRGCSRGGRL